MLTHQELLKLVNYNPLTGQFTRLKKLNRLGAWIDCIEPIDRLPVNGYIPINLGRERYQAHRLAWFYMTGSLPTANVDHKDGNRSNNQWTNLRLAPGSLNHINCKVHRHNTSGHRGVSWSNHFNKWVACVYINNKQKRLGYFESIDDAIAARQSAEEQFYGPGSRIRD